MLTNPETEKLTNSYSDLPFTFSVIKQDRVVFKSGYRWESLSKHEKGKFSKESGAKVTKDIDSWLSETISKTDKSEKNKENTKNWDLSTNV